MVKTRCLILLLTVSLPLYVSIQACQRGIWKKLNHTPRCIGAKDDFYSSLQYHGQSKFLAAVKFVYLSGQIRCLDPAVHNSKWGCDKSVHSTLNIFLTDWKNHVIYPRKKYVTFSHPGMWYGLPGFDEISAELVLSDFANPFYLYDNQRMRIWYGEDLFDVSEFDNHGKVCMDVYGYVI